MAQPNSSAVSIMDISEERDILCQLQRQISQLIEQNKALIETIKEKDSLIDKLSSRLDKVLEELDALRGEPSTAPEKPGLKGPPNSQNLATASGKRKKSAKQTLAKTKKNDTGSRFACLDVDPFPELPNTSETGSENESTTQQMEVQTEKAPPQRNALNELKAHHSPTPGCSKEQPSFLNGPARPPPTSDGKTSAKQAETSASTSNVYKEKIPPIILVDKAKWPRLSQ